VSWSPKGSQLAVCYTSGERHHGWCRHIGVPVIVWSLRQSLLAKGPLHTIPFDSCASVIKFHPNLGNYLAVGFNSGEVALIDLTGMDKVPDERDVSAYLIAQGKIRNAW
jgi:hypothetical protein